MTGDLVTLQQLAELEDAPYYVIKKAYQRQVYSLVQRGGSQPLVRIIDPAISSQAKDKYFNPPVPVKPAGTIPPTTAQEEVMTLPVPSLSTLERKDGIISTTELKDWQRECMIARLAILSTVESIKCEHEISIHKAIKQFLKLLSDDYPSERFKKIIPTANHRDGEKRALSDKTIYRWLKIKNEYGILGLAPEDTEKLIVPAWADKFLTIYRVAGKASVPDALEQMGAEAPSYGQAVRFLKKFSRIDAQRGRMTGSELRSIGSHIVRDKSGLLPLDVVVADGHSYKAKVAHPVHGKPFNPEVEGVVDVRTRVCLGWSAGLAESAQIVADGLRHAVTVNDKKRYGGVPAIFYCDQGAGNKAKMMSAEMTGILARIGTRLELGIPGNPLGRGVIEVFQKTWVRSARKLPTCTAGNMDSLSYRKAIRLVEKDIKERRIPEQLLSWPQFLDYCQETIDKYNNRPHSGLPKITSGQGFRRHMAPLEMWNKFTHEGWQPTILRDDEIKDLFRPQVTVITRNGMVTVFTNSYYNKILTHYHGDDVCVNYDIHDPKIVWVRDQQQRLICEAVFEANKRHYFPMPVVERARDQRAKRREQLLQEKIKDVRLERMGLTGAEVGTVSYAEIMPEEKPEEKLKIFNFEYEKEEYENQREEDSG